MAMSNEKQRTFSDDGTVVFEGEARKHSPDSSSITPREVDDTYNAYKGGFDDEISPAEAKRVLRKTDLRILPIILLAYGLQYLDKTGINFASVFGLQKGNHLTGQDYSWTSSIFYFGYLVAQYPAGYAMQKLPIGKYLASVTLGSSFLLGSEVLSKLTWSSSRDYCDDHGRLQLFRRISHKSLLSRNG